MQELSQQPRLVETQAPAQADALLYRDAFSIHHTLLPCATFFCPAVFFPYSGYRQEQVDCFISRKAGILITLHKRKKKGQAPGICSVADVAFSREVPNETWMQDCWSNNRANTSPRDCKGYLVDTLLAPPYHCCETRNILSIVPPFWGG